MQSSHSSKLTVEDIRYGSYFEYDLIKWKAVGENNYRWSDGRFSREFKISGNGEIRYLEIEDQEKELRILVSKKVGISLVSGNIKVLFSEKHNPPKTLTFRNKNYHLREEAEGEFSDIYSNDGWEPFTTWDYYDSSQKNILSIERWEGDDFEAYLAKIVSPQDFTNILKSKQRPPSSPNWFTKNISLWVLLGFFVIQFTLCRKDKQGDYQYPAHQSSAYSLSKEGLTEVIEQYQVHPNMTILLNDMKFQTGYFYHQYEVFFESGESIQAETTDWKMVSPDFFKKHKDHLGLEVAHQKDGILKEAAAPPGYSNYVGNEQYGAWEEDANGNRVWRFLAQYAFLNAIFSNNFGAPRFNTWRQYRSNPLGTTNLFNTQKYLTSRRGRLTQWGQTPQNIREEAEEEAESGSSSSRGRTYRNSNRYSNKSSRSRSGRGGK